jgi:aspartate racemase
MRTLGIIGGIAPPSTIDYYRQLTKRYEQRSPAGSYPQIIIDSIDGRRFFALLEAADRPGMIEVLLAELERLARAGADLAIFASNTPHLVFDEVAASSPLPLISIVEETAKIAAATGFKRVGLLGARFTMEAAFYPTVLRRQGIDVVVPPPSDRAYVHEKYFGELVEGQFLDETRAGVLALVARLEALEGIEAVILGGTELPLLLRDADAVVPMLDTTAIHVDAAIERLLEP